ncbi:MAG TPA: DUF3373 domain-containing protein [Desulfuromonadales bacterium]|nr:DUF3373 domain-containing protein [Desulfuromonadales bacterium]
MRKVSIVLLAVLLAVPSMVLGQSLEEQVKELQEELEYISERVDRTERHTATDRITFTGDFRTKAHSVHYQDLTWSPGVTVPGMGSFSMFGPGFQPEKKDLDNDILYTTRLRLNMKAKVYENVSFAGRLSMYKNWGDSTGVKVFDSWDAFTMDGTNSGNTTGDWLRVERAYFDWKNIAGSNFYLSIGRRPSTYGPPTQYRENEMRGGTPSGHLVNFNFDGITIGHKLGEITGVEGQVARFCYGQGYESQHGNGELFEGDDFATEDTHLGGFNLDLLNDGKNFLQLTAFAALDVTDGFKGTFAFPSQLMELFAPTINQDAQNFPNMNFVTRYQPSTTIGDIYLGGLGYAREEWSGLTYFASLGWTRLKPNGDAGMFGGMGSDEAYQLEDLDDDGIPETPVPTGEVVDDSTHDGYSIYAGLQVPAPLGKFGVEYNYGSKYWTPFTQAQDDIIGSKLATRGHVGETYYIFDVNPRMFIKLAGLYYDYEYTNSGSPVGAPQNVDEVQAGDAFSMLPAVDTAWDANASLTIKF